MTVTGIVRRVLGLAMALGMAGCGSGGSSGSDETPIAAVTVIGAGSDSIGNPVVRSGGVVVLSAKDSSGLDGPILEYVFEGENTRTGELVTLEERTANSRAFRAPLVTTDTRFDFRLTVRDSQGDEGFERISLLVKAAGDINRFLSPVDGPALGSVGSTEADFESFRLHLRPTSGSCVDATFDLAVDVYAYYPDRTVADCSNADAITTQNGKRQCLRWDANRLEGLDAIELPGGQSVPIVRTGIPWRVQGGACAAETIVELPIPGLDIGAVNQLLLDRTGDRTRLLDPWKADSAALILRFRTSSTPVTATFAVSGPAADPGTPFDVHGATNLAGSVLTSWVSTDEILESAADGLQIETAETAAAYARAIDPNGEFRTLDDWLRARGFIAPDGSLAVDVVQGNDEFAHATYLNNFDLGFGRDMYARVVKPGNEGPGQSPGDVYAFVTNYPTLQGAIEKRGSFATVVMEYSQSRLPGAGTDKFTKFFVFVPDETTNEQVRVDRIDFDGRGLKRVPGVCVACHSGTVPSKSDALAVGGYATGGNIGAAFMPWDLDAFLYSDDDPAIPRRALTVDTRTLDVVDPDRRFTRAAQEAQLRKLNIATLATYRQTEPNGGTRFDAARALLALWYPDPIDPGAPECRLDVGTCLAGSFTSRAVPEADWPGADGARLYRDVFASHCRACHTLLATTKRFKTAQEFVSNAKMIDFIFRSGVMPQARLTSDRLWTGTADHPTPIDVLRDAICPPDSDADLAGECDVVPGRPIVVASGEEVPVDAVGQANDYFEVRQALDASFLTKVGRTVPIEVKQLLFADSVAWALTDEPADCMPVASAHTLVSTSLTSATFSAGEPSDSGRYFCIEAIAGSGAQAVASDPVRVRAVGASRAPIAIASNCQDGSTETPCNRVNEQGGVLDLSGAERSTPVGPDPGADVFLSVYDEDLVDELDPASAIEIGFAPSFPSARGDLSLDGAALPARIGFDRFLAGDVVYTANATELGQTAQLDDLGFRVYDGGQAVGPGLQTATIEIDPVNGNAPAFSFVGDQEIDVPFGQTGSFDFSVSDADGESPSVTPSYGLPPSFGSSVFENVVGDDYQFRYTADFAAQPPIVCSGPGQPNPIGADFVRFFGSDGVNGTSSGQLRINITPTRSYADVQSLLSQPYVLEGGLGTAICSDCHVDGSTSAPPYLASYAVISGLVDVSNPASSSLVNYPLSAGHGGGQFSATDPGWLSTQQQILDWITQCAPELTTGGGE